MFAKIKRLLLNEDGPTAVEYAVMLALIVIVAIGSIKALANQTAASFNDSAAQIAAAFGS